MCVHVCILKQAISHGSNCTVAQYTYIYVCTSTAKRKQAKRCRTQLGYRSSQRE